jgi:hypothetical protein
VPTLFRMVDLSDIFQATSSVTSILAYMGMMESKEQAALKMLQQLADSELAAGLNALQQAHRSQAETIFLLREARNRFNKAIVLEKGVRQAHAYFGLAVCHSNLGDGENAWIALNGLLAVQVGRYSTFVGYIRSVGTATIGTLASAFVGLGHLGGVAGYRYGQKLAEADQERVANERRALAEIKRATWRYLHPGETKNNVEAVYEPIQEVLGLEDRVEVDCPNCRQTARVPSGRGRLRVTCPRCQRRYEAAT